ncbi:MAG: hypothetical protein RR091_11080 [Cloacibacillus sp.]
MKAINAIQHDQPDSQLAGIALAFLALLSRYNANAADVLTIADNIKKSAKRYDHAQIRALQLYFDNEL